MIPYYLNSQFLEEPATQLKVLQAQVGQLRCQEEKKFNLANLRLGQSLIIARIVTSFRNYGLRSALLLRNTSRLRATQSETEHRSLVGLTYSKVLFCPDKGAQYLLMVSLQMLPS